MRALKYPVYFLVNKQTKINILNSLLISTIDYAYPYNPVR